MISLQYIVIRLAANAEVFRDQLAGVPPEQAQWKPSPDKWSLLEVINHLADEEREDFRKRLDLTINSPEQPWPPIDPPRWVVERDYNSRELVASMEDFSSERLRSIQWLSSLSNVNWAAEHVHPQFGIFKAGDLMGSWMAHDLIHIRQINRLHYQYLTAQLGSYSATYAGTW
jgi:hypothetical protein